EQQQRLDSEARRLANQYNQLKAAFVDEDTSTIVGVDQQVLREENYLIDVQTQITGYQGCIENTQAEYDFESGELVKAVKQLNTMESNVRSNFREVYDYTY